MDLTRRATTPPRQPTAAGPKPGKAANWMPPEHRGQSSPRRLHSWPKEPMGPPPDTCDGQRNPWDRHQTTCDGRDHPRPWAHPPSAAPLQQAPKLLPPPPGRPKTRGGSTSWGGCWPTTRPRTGPSLTNWPKLSGRTEQSSSSPPLRLQLFTAQQTAPHGSPRPHGS